LFGGWAAKVELDQLRADDDDVVEENFGIRVVVASASL
jgi:hypothetical protein